MNEVIINKQISGARFKTGTFLCADCDKEVTRRSAFHIRCAECAKEATQGVTGKRFNRFFPVYNPDMKYLCEYLYEGLNKSERVHQKRQEEERKDRLKLYEALRGPTPCLGCRYFVTCANEKLMCRAFSVWANQNIKSGSWGQIKTPSGKYYERHFNDSTRIVPTFKRTAGSSERPVQSASQ